MEGNDPLARLAALRSANRENALANRSYYAVMFQRPIPAFEPSPEAYRASLEPLQLLVEGVGECIDSGVFGHHDAAHIAGVLWAAAYGAVSLELAGYAEAAEAKARFDDLLAGVAAWCVAPQPQDDWRKERRMRIGLTEVFVDDQDKARAFYTEVLGLQVKVDAPYSDSARWLTVVAPEDPDGTELLLAPMTDAAAALQAARREASTPAVSFTTDDCRRSYEELTAKGAVFLAEPTEMGYGGIGAVLEDGCGNLLNLHQTQPAVMG